MFLKSQNHIGKPATHFAHVKISNFLGFQIGFVTFTHACEKKPKEGNDLIISNLRMCGKLRHIVAWEAIMCCKLQHVLNFEMSKSFPFLGFFL